MRRGSLALSVVWTVLFAFCVHDSCSTRRTQRTHGENTPEQEFAEEIIKLGEKRKYREVEEALSRDAGSAFTVNSVNSHGATALHHAAHNGDVRLVRLLVDFGANVDVRNKELYTPLVFAAMKGHTQVVNVLLDANCEVDALTIHEGTALMHAVWMNHKSIVEVLLLAGADAFRKDKDNYSAISIAKSMGHADINDIIKRLAKIQRLEKPLPIDGENSGL